MPEANYHVVENRTIEKILEEGRGKAEKKIKEKKQIKGQRKRQRKKKREKAKKRKWRLVKLNLIKEKIHAPYAN